MCCANRRRDGKNPRLSSGFEHLSVWGRRLNLCELLNSFHRLYFFSRSSRGPVHPLNRRSYLECRALAYYHYPLTDKCILHFDNNRIGWSWQNTSISPVG